MLKSAQLDPRYKYPPLGICLEPFFPSALWPTLLQPALVRFVPRFPSGPLSLAGLAACNGEGTLKALQGWELAGRVGRHGEDAKFCAASKTPGKCAFSRLISEHLSLFAQVFILLSPIFTRLSQVTEKINSPDPQEKKEKGKALGRNLLTTKPTPKQGLKPGQSCLWRARAGISR